MSALTIFIPDELHHDTAALVGGFATALAEKLRAAEVKYGYSNLWADKGWMDECRAKLIQHVHKGDPRDVAAYCAFLWHHNERTELSEQFIFDVLGKWPGVAGPGKLPDSAVPNGVNLPRPSLSVDEANTAVAVAKTKAERLAAYRALAAAADAEAQRLAIDGVADSQNGSQADVTRNGGA